MEQTIIYQITKQSNPWNEEVFLVPCSTNQLCLSVSLLHTFRCVGMLFLTDPSGTLRLQKQLGHGTLCFGIGASGKDTSVGGVPGKIEKGFWQLNLTIFTEYLTQLPASEVYEVVVTITDQILPLTETIGTNVWFTKEAGVDKKNTLFDWNASYNLSSRWYKGDFHTHTTLSDGKETISRAMEKAHTSDLDFYIPTEHNLIHTGWPESSLCIIPGIEITTSLGHFNLFGIDHLPAGIIDITRENGTPQIASHIERVLRQAKEEGWIISINHPFLSVWKWTYGQLSLSDISCIELINDPTYIGASEANDRTIRFLDSLWEEGYIIYGVGGSDSHNFIEERYEGATQPSVAGDPGTYVFCQGLSPKTLLKQVKSGAICITRFCKITPQIQLGDALYLPGQELDLKKGFTELSYTLKIEGLKDCPKVFLVCNQEYQTLTVEQHNDLYIARTAISLTQKQWQWIRMEVRTKDDQFLGYVNPVYYGKKTPSCITYEDVCKRMEKKDDKRHII